MTQQELEEKVNEMHDVMLKQNFEMWALATTTGALKLALIEKGILSKELIEKHEQDLANEIKQELEKTINADNKGKTTDTKDNNGAG